MRTAIAKIRSDRNASRQRRMQVDNRIDNLASRPVSVYQPNHSIGAILR